MRQSAGLSDLPLLSVLCLFFQTGHKSGNQCLHISVSEESAPHIFPNPQAGESYSHNHPHAHSHRNHLHLYSFLHSDRSRKAYKPADLILNPPALHF